jgi:hypothetical protein
VLSLKIKEFELGDEVSVAGEVGRVDMVMGSFINGICEYGVRFKDSTIKYYKPEDLELHYRKSTKCSCGAERTYYPDPPPGHAHHCEVLNEEYEWGII